MTPNVRQTLELLVAQERKRIEDELNADASPQTYLDDASTGWFQDIEPMTFEEYALRLEQLEMELLGSDTEEWPDVEDVIPMHDLGQN